MIYILEQRENNRAAAYELLRRGLREEYGIGGEVAFVRGRHGKPYLAGYPHIFFNLSHCRAGAACVISDREAGIDMQDIRPFSQRAARRVCTEAELKQLADAPDPDRLFGRLWCIKEAYIKLHGGSIMGEIVDTEKVIARAFLHESTDYWLCCFGGATRT
jgi:4'-phosphopantetheinyl transferase